MDIFRYTCPKCQSHNHFVVEAKVLVGMFPDTNDPESDEYECDILDDIARQHGNGIDPIDSGYCRCTACGHEGILEDFKTDKVSRIKRLVKVGIRPYYAYKDDNEMILQAKEAFCEDIETWVKYKTLYDSLSIDDAPDALPSNISDFLLHTCEECDAVWDDKEDGDRKKNHDICAQCRMREYAE